MSGRLAAGSTHRKALCEPRSGEGHFSFKSANRRNFSGEDIAMAEHEPSIGLSSDWYTPPVYFEKLGLTFDLDPCSPGPGNWVPAKKIYTKADNGLLQPWHGLVFMNPPHAEGRRMAVPWLRKFLDHANGIAICRAYTSCDYWHALVWPRAELLCFPDGKIKFIRPDGSVGKEPGHGSAFIAMGAVARAALRRSGIGVCVTVERDAPLGQQVREEMGVIPERVP